jgi:hypothetical protein
MRFDGSVVCQPRHPDGFTARAEDLLVEFRISGVAADPLLRASRPVGDRPSPIRTGAARRGLGQSFAFKAALKMARRICSVPRQRRTHRERRSLCHS